MEINHDALLDSRIVRHVREQYNGMAMYEEFRITLPDNSVITAFAEWCAAPTHLTTGIQDADRWLMADHNPQRTTLHPTAHPDAVSST